jgi:hypothetical protein
MHRHPNSSSLVTPATRIALLLSLPMASLSSCIESGDDDLGDDPGWRVVHEPLPSGVDCSVEVTTPANGAVLPSSPVAVTGFATVGAAVPDPRTTMTYVMDLSGSTDQPGGCGGDPNNDGSSNTILDCEIAALTELHNQAILLGTIFDIGIAVFASSGATADMAPGAPNELLTGPNTDLGRPGSPNNVPNGVPDVLDILRSAESDVSGGPGTLDLFASRSVGQVTSFGAGLGAAATALSASAQPRQLVVFVSDGLSNTPPSVAAALATFPPGANVYTFAVGASSNCDSDPFGLGSLRDISDATSGTCTNVPNPSNLPSILPGVVMSQLVGLELTLDGVPALITNITPGLPQQGPATVNYSTTLPTPAPGQHTICAEATCSDASGVVDPTECKVFTVLAPNHPPDARCHDVSVAADATCHASASVDNGSFDPDPGDSITCTANPSGPYSLGTTLVTLTCVDSHGASDQCQGHVEVVDTTPPTVSPGGIIASLWPPNHGYHTFSMNDCVGEIQDNCAEVDPSVTVVVDRITSDEGEMARGSGNTCDDAVIDSATSFRVRAERSGNDDGRVYGIHGTVYDASGNHAPASCQIVVPHDQGNGDYAVDSGCALCVGTGCGGCSMGVDACN